jgi:hypothetical protein
MIKITNISIVYGMSEKTRHPNVVFIGAIEHLLVMMMMMRMAGTFLHLIDFEGD